MLFGRSETGAPRVLTLLRRLGQLIAVAGVLLLPAHEPLLAQAAVSEGPGPGIAWEGEPRPGAGGLVLFGGVAVGRGLDGADDSRGMV